MNYTEAFAKYGAVLKNQQWSVSAFGKSGDLVVCLWQNLLKRGAERSTLEYRDTLSLWLGNSHGNTELRGHLAEVQASGRTIRLVIAHPVSPEDEERIGKVSDESEIEKTFSIKPDVVGTLEEFDSDKFVIIFRKAA